jgi:RES domain-containing protein
VKTAFDGEGASQYGGRWNSKGTRAVYTSSSLALAALEMIVNSGPNELIGDFAAISVHIPENLPRTSVSLKELPRAWRNYPAPNELQVMGDQWSQSGATAVLEVPSVVVPFEKNVILNPAHADFARVRIGNPVAFEFDPRLHVPRK